MVGMVYRDKRLKHHGEAASANAETVEKERKRNQELIMKYSYELRDIFNMFETGLFYVYIFEPCI
jgi:hypothetical protein